MVPLVPGLVMVLGLSMASCYPSHLVATLDMSLTEVLENMKDKILETRSLKDAFDRQMREPW